MMSEGPKSKDRELQNLGATPEKALFLMLPKHTLSSLIGGTQSQVPTDDLSSWAVPQVWRQSIKCSGSEQFSSVKVNTTILNQVQKQNQQLVQH